MTRYIKIYLFLFWIGGCLPAVAQFYNGMNKDFGKNRVQYQPFNWTYFKFERYQVFMYEGGKEIARYVAKQTDFHLKDIEKKLDYQTDKSIQVMVYNNQGDFRQSNLGLDDGSDGNLGGATHINGTKVSVYFTGNHADLDRQIRAGIANVLIDEILFGGNAREKLKNSTLLVFPDWFKDGLVAYLAETWNSGYDNKERDGLNPQNTYFMHPNNMNARQSTAAGHAFWNYLVQTYGVSTITHLLNMLKVHRNLDNAFIFEFGSTVESMMYEWSDEFYKQSKDEDTSRHFPGHIPILKKPKVNRVYYGPRLDPSGERLAYVTCELSQYKVFVKNLKDKKRPKRILKYGPKIERLNDYTYPLLSWHPVENALAVIVERKGIIYLVLYDFERDEKIERPITGIEKISDFGYAEDGKKIVFSGVKKGKGQADIFVYSTNMGGIEQITNDIWDDEHPRFVCNGEFIAFSSNRLNDTIKNTENAKFNYTLGFNHDLFLYDVKKKSKVLFRVTETPDVHETMPRDWRNGSFMYISDANGISNKYLAKMDSVISYVDTMEHYRYVFNPKPVSNYPYSLQDYDVASRSMKSAEVFFTYGKDYMFLKELGKEIPSIKLQDTPYRKKLNRKREKLVLEQKSKQEEENTSGTEPTEEKKGPIINNYAFKSEPGIDSTNAAQKIDSLVDSLKPRVVAKKEFELPIQENYFTNFSIDASSNQLDNSFLSPVYQRFTGFYVNPSQSILNKVSITDLFEDYKVLGAFRFGGFNSNEYLLSVENRKWLWDKQLILHRQSMVIEQNDYLVKSFTHDGQLKFKFPFNEVSSLRMTFSLRNEKRVHVAVDDYSLYKGNKYENWGGIKAEYVFDNTRYKGLNLYNGWRLKVFSEYYRKDDFEKRHDLITFGFDIRHYLKLFRHIIWANRLAGSTAWGKDKLVYYLGGVDNWMYSRNRFDTSITILHPEVYSFQTIATNLRGFRQNVRNGNNFCVLNSELRIPFFRAIMDKPLKNDFFQQFQIIGFADVGAAWYGTSPLSKENTENRLHLPGNPINVVIIQQKEPIIAGYGFGFRSRLFGYFMRLDYAWGYDNKIQHDRIVYFSLSTDF